MRKISPIVLCLLLFAGSAWAAEATKIFVNNKPFKGKVSGPPKDLQLEAAAVLEILGLKIPLDPAATSLDLGEGRVVAVTEGMLSASELVRAFGGKYSYTPELGMVDIHAYDPVESARKAMINILKLSKVTSDADFDVCCLLTKQCLVQDLGLTLDVPAKIFFCTQAEMTKAGAGANVACYVKFTGERKGTGTADYRFFVLKGQSALALIGDMAWSWGITWANDQGLHREPALTTAFAYWTQTKVLQKIAGVGSSRRIASHIQRTHPKSVEPYNQLVEMEGTGGIEAVFKYLREKNS